MEDRRERKRTGRRAGKRDGKLFVGRAGKRSRKRNATNMANSVLLGRIGELAGRVLWLIAAGMLVVASIGAAASSIGLEPAWAADFDSRGEYADALLGDQGWKSDLITGYESDAADETGNGTGLVDQIDDFLYAMSGIIIALSLLFSVLRIAIRGTISSFGYEINANSEKGENRLGRFWVLFMTSEERQRNIAQREWIAPMLRETLIFFIIGIGAGVLVGLFAWFAGFIMNEGIKEASTAGVNKFSMSGIDVKTTQ